MDLTTIKQSDIVLSGVVLAGYSTDSLSPVDQHPGQNYEWDNGSVLLWDNGSAVLTE